MFRLRTPRQLQHYRLTKHEDTDSHKMAVRHYLHGTEMSKAPSIEVFQDIAKKILKGCATCSNRRDRKITWLISEALAEEDRTAIKQAEAIALFRDESKHRLSIRFRAVSPDLDEHSATLGHERDFGTGATKITEATGKSMRKMCTKLHGAPKKVGRFHGVTELDRRMLQHLRQGVVAITVDSATDECLSAEMMRSPALAGQEGVLTPSLRWLLRDKPHSARRLLSRPWAADPYLKDVVMMCCRGRKSPARIIQCSGEVRRVFTRFVRGSAGAVLSSVTNMRAAGHRYESFQKPIGRTCLHLHSTIRTALYLTLHRNDESAKSCKEWLVWLSTERCLQLAMMADASDQVLVLVRLLDNENVDPAILNREVFYFIRTIRSMFNDRQCLHIFGYTSMMLGTLKQVHLSVAGSRPT